MSILDLDQFLSDARAAGVKCEYERGIDFNHFLPNDPGTDCVRFFCKPGIRVFADGRAQLSMGIGEDKAVVGDAKKILDLLHRFLNSPEYFERSGATRSVPA